MKYRTFGNTGFQVSSLGYGAMRMTARSGKALHYAIDHGVNYIDTAYAYHNGLNEIMLGRILKQAGYKKRVKIATKLPCWLISSPQDPDKYLNEQLKRLQIEHIEFYLLHALYKERWLNLNHYKILDWAEKVKKQGKIGHFGFSFHDSYDVFKAIIDGYDQWDFCYIQYNYLNENIQAGKVGLDYASKKGIAVVIMEPLLGGVLANPPLEIKQFFEEQQEDPVDIALRWLWDKPEVSCVLSGMASVEQVTQNVKIADQYGIGNLSSREKKLIEQVKSLYNQADPIMCTKCKYCMPCPSHVDIPFILELYREAVNYNKYALNKLFYSIHIADESKASACTQCRLCEEKCPQKIRISEWMQKIQKEFSAS